MQLREDASMKFGICLPTYPFGMEPSREAIEKVARAGERLGYDSLWTSDHILPPRDKPRYGNLYEALTTLAFLAGITTRVELGTSVLVLPLRDPRLVAKQIATIDALSGGRVTLGIGVGWMEDEFKAVGAEFRRRGKRVDEAIRAMRTLWTDPNPVFDGEFYQFRDVYCEPRPARAGGPRLEFGGYGAATLRRAATFGDGWHADDMTPDKLSEMGRELRALAQAKGRAVSITLRRTVDMRPAAAAAGRLKPPTEAGGIQAGKWTGGSAGALSGSADEVRRGVEEVAALGVDHFVCQFEQANLEEHMASVEVFAEAIIATHKAAAPHEADGAAQSRRK
jgi:probable F420-dependent oxidoreductase